MKDRDRLHRFRHCFFRVYLHTNQRNKEVLRTINHNYTFDTSHFFNILQETSFAGLSAKTMSKCIVPISNAVEAYTASPGGKKCRKAFRNKIISSSFLLHGASKSPFFSFISFTIRTSNSLHSRYQTLPPRRPHLFIYYIRH